MTATDNYPFPTPEDDELFDQLGIEPRRFELNQLESARDQWNALGGYGLDASLFIKLVAVCEGALAEATVLWDALRMHYIEGLRQYQERSGRYYTSRYPGVFLSERSCQRAFNDLAEAGLIVLWPRSRTIGQKFRLDWVELSMRLKAMDGLLFPGLDSAPANLKQGAGSV